MLESKISALHSLLVFLVVQNAVSEKIGCYSIKIPNKFHENLLLSIFQLFVVLC